MPRFRSREVVDAVRFDPDKPPTGLYWDDEEELYVVVDTPHYMPVRTGDWVLLDGNGRATESMTDAEFRAAYEPVRDDGAIRGLLAACEAYDAAWLASCPEGPDGGAGRLSASTVQLWKQIRAAISAAK